MKIFCCDFFRVLMVGSVEGCVLDGLVCVLLQRRCSYLDIVKMFIYRMIPKRQTNLSAYTLGFI